MNGRIPTIIALSLVAMIGLLLFHGVSTIFTSMPDNRPTGILLAAAHAQDLPQIVSGPPDSLAVSSVTRDTPIPRAFLPAVMKALVSVGIFGRVTANGFPAAGATIYLIVFDGVDRIILQYTETNTYGRYQFLDLRSLYPGEVYIVEYLGGDVNCLNSWSTPFIQTYTEGEDYQVGTFDIADVALVYPPYNTVVSFPVTFQWSPRPATPTDSYQFHLIETTRRYPDFYSSPLGYVNSYTLNSLPAGFSYGPYYRWDIQITDPDGGIGVSSYGQLIAFTPTTNLKSPGAETTISDIEKERWR